MTDRIVVHVMNYGPNRKFLQLRWVDPRTGRWKTKSSGCTKREEAFKAAARLEIELNGARHSDDGTMAWRDFRETYHLEHGSAVAQRTAMEIVSIFNQLERVCNPTTLRSVDSRMLSLYATKRRAEGVSEDTIAKHFRHIQHSLRWAVGQKYLPTLPVFPAVKRKRKGKESKGRPITAAEFDTLLAAVHQTHGITADTANSWQHLLRGLWLSGLRISEAMTLRWEPGNWLSLDASNPQRPKLRIPGSQQKSGEDQLLPLTPDFGEFITQGATRAGFVFNPLRGIGKNAGKRMNAVGDAIVQISEIGKQSGVIVDAIRGKTVTAHDLRRSFGSRWAVLVMPVVLKELMRHASIDTTLKYYVGQDLDRTHDAVLQALSGANDITRDNTGKDSINANGSGG